MLVGGYTPSRGSSAGITVVEHDRAAGSLHVLGTAVSTRSPSALAISADRRTIFAVEEDGAGSVHSFRWSAETELRRVSSQPSGGADPCHLLVHPSGRWLLSANYAGSTISALPIGAEGALAAPSDVRRFRGSGPHPQRQSDSHPHMIATRPGTSELAVADLGADVIRRLIFDPDSGRFGADLPAVELKPRSGPRQIVFTHDGARSYVLGELDSEITVIDWSTDEPCVSEQQPCFADGTPPSNLGGSLLLSELGELFASQRGADVVSRFHLDDDRLRLVDALPAGGNGPRHIAVLGDWLYVANEVSGTVVAMTVSGSEETLRTPVPSATYILVV
jgi:6-phosphogluconolactonase